MMLTPGHTYVRKLRARVPTGVDRSGSSLRLGHAVGGLDIGVGLPPEAILLVRRFADPLPGRLKSDGSPPPIAWREAVTESLRTVAARAARPSTEVVGPNANAVLFADRAELLACLARDWCCGDAHGKWWWRLLSPTSDPASAVATTWAENPQHVPTALRRLDEVNGARDFLAALPRSSVAPLLWSVLEVFGLDDLRRGLTIEPRSTPSTVEDVPVVRARAPGPWIRWVNVDPLLPAEQRQLLVIALMLERAPGVLRSHPFIRAWQTWERAADKPAADGAPSATPPWLDNRQAVPAAAAAENSSGGQTVLPEIEGTAGFEFTPIERIREIRSRRVAVQGAAPEGDTATTTFRVPGIPAAPATLAEIKPATRTPDVLATLPEPQREVVPTAWGGVFYLVNVALAFGFYTDFTRPRDAGLALPVWDFLTLLGQRMAGRESLADPLWPLLARLAGRSEDALPGLGFEPPAEWRIPPEWLAGLEKGGVWSWASKGDRLCLQHSQGFLMLDVPLADEKSTARLERELRQFGAESKPVLQENIEITRVRIADPLEQWLAWLIPCIRARLASALGRDAAAASALVFRQRATVEVTADCVTVRFRLVEHPIELRMAGLDRDPGWIPSAGRRITFHYD